MNTAANVVNCIRRMLGSIRVRLLLFVVVALAVSLLMLTGEAVCGLLFGLIL